MENRSCLSGCDSLLHLSCAGNPVVDALLFSKRTACEVQGVQFSAAGTAHPFVRLSSDIKKSVWIVKTENTKNPANHPIQKTATADPPSPLPPAEKTDRLLLYVLSFFAS